MLKITWTIMLLLFVSFGLDAAEVYKWVDENGVIHYSDHPPQTEQFSEIDVPEGQAEETPGEGVYSETVEEARIRRELRAREKEQALKERKAEEEKKATSSATCARAIHYLNTLKRQCPVFYDGAGILRAQCPGWYSFYEGERTYIDDKEREKLIEHYQKTVDQCKETFR